MRKNIILFMLVFMIIVLQGCDDTEKVSDNKENELNTTEYTESSTEIELNTTEYTESSTENEAMTTEYDEQSTEINDSSEFTSDWYKEYAYFMCDEQKLELCYLDGGIVQVFINEVGAFDYDANEYTNEYDGVYVYRDELNEAELTYFSDDHSIMVLLNGEYKEYYPVDEETYYASETVSEDDNYVEENTTNNYSEEEICQAASYYIWDAIQDTTYANYDWECIRVTGISSYVGGGYTVTFYMHSNMMNSYKYLRVNIGVSSTGFYFISGGM